MYDLLRDQGHWVLPKVLEFQARNRSSAPFVGMVDGPMLTYGDARAEARRVAGWLAGLGVSPGEPVAVMLPNSMDFVRTWLGLGHLGAPMVALNCDLKGAFLEHQMVNAGARLAIVAPEFLDRFVAIADRLESLETVVVTAPGHDAAAKCAPFALAGFDGWRTASPWTGALPGPGDVACIMYTSGTTGPSKGVLMPHGHCYLFGLGTIDNLGLREDDRFYIVLPLFHANGLFMQLGATLIAGASAILRERFSASAWLDDIRRSEATVTNSLGAVSAFVLAQPRRPDDGDHCLRVLGAAPNPRESEAALRERFSIPHVVSMYGMTEVNIPLYGEVGVSKPGTCGRVYERYFDVEIRDPETDLPVPTGAVGEIVVRPKAAFGFMSGYHRMAEETVRAWRNLWFHTGDAALLDDDGYITFVDRIKDCIRRRGENISSFEVEAAIARMKGVAEVAAFAVPADVEGAEDEVMLAVVSAPGASLDGGAIAAHADQELPRYAWPRYIDILDALPKTPTEKVQKALLRRRGPGPGTWDRERDT